MTVTRIDPAGARQTRERFERLMKMALDRSAAMQSDPQPFYDALAADYMALRQDVWNVLDRSRTSMAPTFAPVAPTHDRMRTVTVPAEEYERYRAASDALEAMARRVGL